MDLKGIVRSLTRFALGADLQLSLSEHGSVQVAQLESPLALLAAHNRRFGAVVGQGSTFIAPVTAVPTTTATFLLYNGEADGGRVYFIDTVGFFLGSGTAPVGGVLLGAVSRERQATVPTAYAGTELRSLSGGALDSKAVLANAITLDNEPAWMVLKECPPAAATTGGGGVAELHGGFAVPPGHGFAMVVMSAAGTNPLYGYSVTWSELKVTLA